MEYNAISSGYDELYGEEQIKKARIILDNISISKADWLLDVGCGTGISTAMFECNKIGIDSSEELISQAITRIPAIIGKGEDLPFNDNIFDIIICLTAIHNFDDYKKGIQEMKRVCKKSGKVIITILKKAKEFNNIKNYIEKELTVVKEIDEEKDLVLIANH